LYGDGGLYGKFLFGTRTKDDESFSSTIKENDVGESLSTDDVEDDDEKEENEQKSI
jgi:hypothetical protein